VTALAQQRRAQPSGWWGMALLIATEATLFSCLIATYFYLRFEAAEWPLGGIEKPSVVLPLVFTGMLVATSLPMFLSVRAAKRGEARLAWWLLLAAAAAQATYLGLQIHLFVGDLSSFSPRQNAYGSIYFVLLGFHHAHVAAGLALDTWLLWKLARGITAYRLTALRVTALYWYFVSAAAIAVVLTQLYPSL
jgi:cytochrome c oxidase subunit III